MNDKHKDERSFLSALADFERCLETPVVPGELPSWLDSAQAACQDVGGLLLDEVEGRHPDMFAEMVREDAAMGPRVQELKSRDKELLAERHEIFVRLQKLSREAAEGEPHEAAEHDKLQQLTDDALAFVIDARKQDRAIATWHAESLHRDRGVAD